MLPMLVILLGKLEMLIINFLHILPILAIFLGKLERSLIF
jgi:hypothetical protein